MKKTPIFICGGHLSPAVAVIEKLRKKNNYSLYYIGRKFALEGDSSKSFEFETIEKMGINFLSITTGRLQRSFTLYTLYSLLKIPIGFLYSFYYLCKIKPKVVLSFGGYVSLPVCLSSYILKIPFVIHEQTHIMGMANRILAKMAVKVLLSWKDTKRVDVGVRTEITGIPLRESIFDNKTYSNNPILKKGKPIILITGGNQGARFINSKIENILPDLLKDYCVIHQCGSTQGKRDYQKLVKLKNSFEKSISSNYFVKTNIGLNEFSDYLKNAKLVISRSGANTVSEITAIGVPAIFIPLAWSADDEQVKNAQVLVSIGASYVLKQKDCTSFKLLHIIKTAMQKRDIMCRNLVKIKQLIDIRSAEIIADIVDRNKKTS